MEAQAERMQMLEGAPRGVAHRTLLHLGEQRVAQLTERRRADPQQAVADALARNRAQLLLDRLDQRARRRS